MSEADETNAMMPEEPPAPVDGSYPEYEDFEPPDTKWPKVIGIISLIYAIGGLLCQVAGSVWVVFGAEAVMGMTGADIEMSMLVKVLTIVSAVLLFGVGVLMLVGSVNLLRRRRSGVSALKMWVVLRLLLLVVGIGLGILMLPANIDFQMQAAEAQAQMLRDRGQSVPASLEKMDRETLWLRSVIGLGVMSGVFAVYPLFLGFYLSRGKISDEAAQWV